MEAPGVYWIPLFELLEQRGFTVLRADARKVKNVSGRKSDVLDCQWLQQLHTFGLLQAPPADRAPGGARIDRGLHDCGLNRIEKDVGHSDPLTEKASCGLGRILDDEKLRLAARSMNRRACHTSRVSGASNPEKKPIVGGPGS